MTRYELAQPELKYVPGTFGDPLRVVQNLPGVARTPFGLGALVIRGASPNDSGIYVEGHKIPILYHFLVGPGVLAPELIDRIDFFPGNFGVTYGRITAGVVDVGIRTTPAPRLHGDGRHQPAAFGGVRRGPAGRRWTGSVSARRSYIDSLLPLVLPDNVVDGGARLLGLPGGREPRPAGRAAVAVRVRQQRHAEGRLQRSRARATSISALEIGFHKVFAVWTQALGNWINKLSPAYGYERVRFGVGRARDQRVGARARRCATICRGSSVRRLTLRFGFDGEAARSIRSSSTSRWCPRRASTASSCPTIEPRTIPLDTLAAGLYADASWEIGRGVTVIPGLRSDCFRYVGQNRFTFDPRLVVRWKWNEVHTWKAGAGIYHQMVDPQLLNPQFGNPNLPPIWADQYSVGFLRTLRRQADAGHDAVLRAPPRHAGAAGAVHVGDGQGRSYGLELILKHEFTERFFGWIAYTLSRSEQTVYAVNAPMQRWQRRTCRIRRRCSRSGSRPTSTRRTT